MLENKSITTYEIGARIRALRESEHESQEKLVQALNVSRELISKIESGRQFPSVIVLARISIYFHVSVDSIIFGGHREAEVVRQLEHVILTLNSIKQRL